MKGTQSRKVSEIKDFSGGLVTKAPWKGIDTKYSIDCMNVYSEGAVLRPRGGYTTVNGTTAAQVGYGLFNWWKTGTSQWLVSFSGATLAKMDSVSSVWDGVQDTLAADGTNGTSFSTSTMYFVTYGSTLIMTNYARSKPQRMLVSDSSYFNLEYGGGGTVHQARFAAVWKTMCWLMNSGSYEDRIWRSSINTYNDWTGVDSGYNDIHTPGDVGLTGWVILLGKLYVFKSWSIHKFTYLGSGGQVVDIREMPTVTGTRSPKTIKVINVPGKGELVIFLGTDRNLYLFDGVQCNPISDYIQVNNGLSTVSMASINKTTLNSAFAVVNPDKNWYELFVCLGTSTAINCSITYDYQAGSFWPNNNRTFSAGTLSDNGSGGARVTYAQDPTNGLIYALESSNSDNGTAINSYWTSSKLGTSILLDRFDELEVETSSDNCRPTFSWRADWETAWTTVTLNSSSYSHNYNPGRIDNLIQFKFADNSTTNRFSLWSIQMNARVLGGGK